MSDNELNACPICGQSPRSFKQDRYRTPDGEDWIVMCVNPRCCAVEVNGLSRVQAEAQWNTRPTEAALSARIAELEAAAREVLNELWETNDEFTEYQQALWEKVPLS